MADAASWAGVDASLRADMGVAERGRSEATRAIGAIYIYLAVFWYTTAGLAGFLPPGYSATFISVMSSPQPPVPFADFEYAFDPALSNLFPPSLPPSADLFSPSETTDLLGFLDNFNWDLESDLPFADPSIPIIPPPPPSASPPLILPPLTQTPPSLDQDVDLLLTPSPSESTPPTRSAQRRTISEPRQTARTKSLLSTPQKRLNHIMSEQKRRNAIRDGYAQLIALIAPAGARTIDLPSRGRPKGSSTRNNGQTKGKSGVLFRAVEYCRWLEEGRDALREEVLRLEAAVIASNARSVARNPRSGPF